MKKLWLLLTLLQTLFISGQNDRYYEGYIVFKNGDTLRGDLLKLPAEQSCLGVIYRDSLNNIARYTKKDILSYKRGKEFYISKDALKSKDLEGYITTRKHYTHHPQKKTTKNLYKASSSLEDIGVQALLKEVMTGKVKLYKHSFINRIEMHNAPIGDPMLGDAITPSVSVGFSSFSGMQVPEEHRYKKKYYLVKDGKVTKVSDRGFKSQMMRYFSDAPDLVKQIKSKKLSFKNIALLVHKYNNLNP